MKNFNDETVTLCSNSFTANTEKRFHVADRSIANKEFVIVGVCGLRSVKRRRNKIEFKVDMAQKKRSLRDILDQERTFPSILWKEIESTNTPSLPKKTNSFHHTVLASCRDLWSDLVSGKPGLLIDPIYLPMNIGIQPTSWSSILITEAEGRVDS